MRLVPVVLLVASLVIGASEVPGLLEGGSESSRRLQGPSLLQRQMRTSQMSGVGELTFTPYPVIVHDPHNTGQSLNEPPTVSLSPGTTLPLGEDTDEHLQTPSPPEQDDLEDLNSHNSNNNHRTKEEEGIEGSEISQALGNDLLGDPLEPTHHGMGREGATRDTLEAKGPAHDVHHKYLALLFFFGALAIGGVILICIDRLLPWLPYTVALFVVGMIISVVHAFKSHDSVVHWPSWFASVEMWQAINPHLLFYAFLPALLFCEAMRLDVQLAAKCFSQVFLLACPGVLLGTFLTGYVGRYLLPYGWDWAIALVFGTVVSATDPVAVVALFNTLGVSPRLTMLISGESLLNDGTAIVCFSLMLKVALGAQLTASEVFVFFTQMTLTGVLLGGAVGYIAVFLIGRCSDNMSHSDSMVQVIATVSCGYLTFFLAESEFSTSGVIATVSSGFVVAYYAWPRFVSRETMNTVWEAIEFIGNTLIFLLAGVLFANAVLQRMSFIRWVDFGWLLILYLAVTVIRAVMLSVFWIPLHMVGKPIHWTEGLVIVWSGLRGAVSLCLAIIVDMEPGIGVHQGSLIMFHVGGIAALTFLVNATLAAPLLKYLGISKASQMKERMLSRFDQHMTEQCTEAFQAQLRHPDDMRFSGANQHVVRAMVPALRGSSHSQTHSHSHTQSHATSMSLMPGESQGDTEQALGRLFRESYLRMVQSFYWEAIEEGIIPRNLKAARVLVNSAGEALEHVDVQLNDWEVIEREIIPPSQPSCLAKCVATIVRKKPFCWISPVWHAFAEEALLMQKVYILLCFQEAHTRAQAEVSKHLPTETALDRRVQQQVAHESVQQCHRAKELLGQVPADMVEFGKSEMLARKLLHQQQQRVANLREKGLLTQSEAAHMDHQVHQALAKIMNTPKDAWGPLVAGVAH